MAKDILIKNGTLFSIDSKRKLYNADILIHENKIQLIQKEISYHRDSEDLRIIDASNHIVMPSFYNLHVHLGETIFRTKCDGMNLWEYLNVSHNTYENSLWKEKESDIHRLSSLITVYECMRNGTGFIVGNRGWKELYQSGLSAICLFPVVNISKLKNYYNNIEEFYKISELYKNTNVSVSIFLQSLYLCDAERLSEIKTIMNSNPEIKLFVHVAETKKEIELIENKYSNTPIKMLDKFGLLGRNTFCIHSIYLTDSDIKLLKEKNTKVVLCPVSNLKLNDGFPQIKKLIENEIPIVVGTDGFATNNSANLLEELKLLALMEHGSINPECLLKMIINNPAECVYGKQNEGQLLVGNMANISIFKAENYMYPDYSSLISNLIYANSEFQCDYLISNGNIVFENNNPSFFDKNQLFDEYNSLTKILFDVKSGGIE